MTPENFQTLIGIVVFFVFVIGFFVVQWYQRKLWKQGKNPGYDPLTGIESPIVTSQGMIKMRQAGNLTALDQTARAKISLGFFLVLGLAILFTFVAIYGENPVFSWMGALFFWGLSGWFGVFLLFVLPKMQGMPIEERKKKYRPMGVALIGLLIFEGSVLLFADTISWTNGLIIFTVFVVLPTMVISIRSRLIKSNT